MAPGLDMHVNGSPLAETQRQADFIERILALQKEVFAGKHPRIRLPPDVIAQNAHLQTATSQAPPPPPSPPPTNGFANGFHPSDTVPRPDATVPKMNDTPYLNSSTGAGSPAAPFHFSDGNSASGPRPSPAARIDPILLQKSEVTLKAEQQLKRQRLERALKEQYDLRKQTAWSEKDGTSDVPAPFSISDTLDKALQLVKHVSGLNSAADRSSSGSSAMHTNSYYSSQDNWSSQDSQSSAKANDANQQQHAKQARSQPATASKQQRQSKTDAFPQGKAFPNPVVCLDAPPCRNHQLAQPSLPEASSPPCFQEPEEVEEGEREESEEYEPPAADELGAATPVHEMMELDHPTRQPPHRISPPLPAASVVRNHIETPLAPQPERVSPLAFAKVPQVGQIQSNELGHHPSPRVTQRALNNHIENRVARQGSPRAEPTQEDSSGSAQGKRKSPRNEGKDGQALRKRRDRRSKRKARAEGAEDQHRRTSNKRQARSPDFEPQIKEEPMSSPLASLAEVPVSRRRQSLLIDDDVEIISPRRTGALYTGEYPASQPAYRHDLQRPESPGMTQPSSRPAQRRVIERDDQDLRRLASLQYARRPPSPQSRITYEEPPPRAASHAYIERPLYREPSTRPAGQPQHVQRFMSPATVYVDDDDFVAPRAPRHVPASSAMPPPPARPDVVVDQYGNRYVAAPPESAYQSRRASVVPVSSRKIDPDVYERAITRAPRRVTDRYDDEDEMIQTSPRTAPGTTSARYVMDRYGQEMEIEQMPDRELGLQDTPQRYRGQPGQAHQPREVERAHSIRPREDDQATVRRLRDRTEMGPLPSTPYRQSVVYDDAPQGYTFAQPASRVQRSFSVRPSALSDAENMPPPPSTMRASVQPQARQQSREYLVRDPVSRGYRAVSVVHEGGIRGEEWAMMPQQMEPAQGRFQYVSADRDGAMQRVQSVRREYTDDPMEVVNSGYGGMAGSRTEFRY